MTQRALLATLFPYTTLFRSVTSRQGNIDALLLQLLPQPTELLESRDGDRAVVALALQLPRRYLNERLHHLRQFLVDRKSTRLNSSHRCISSAVFCLIKKQV